jgi:hypothetical protein
MCGNSGSPLNRKRSPHDPSPLTYNPFSLNLWILTPHILPNLWI